MNSISFLYSTRDRAAALFSPPFTAPHNGVAIRAFTDAVNDSRRDSDISKHPDDFDLYLVGEFDSATGDVKLLKHPDPIVLGKQVALGTTTNLDLFRAGNSPTGRDHDPIDTQIFDPNFKVPAR